MKPDLVSSLFKDYKSFYNLMYSYYKMAWRLVWFKFYPNLVEFFNSFIFWNTWSNRSIFCWVFRFLFY